jgi:phosphoglycolate phosphatase
MKKKLVSVVITDLDNTLYDWVEIWYQSFRPMLDCLVNQSSIEQGQLEAEIRQIFQQHGTSEYAFLIEALPSLKSRYPEDDLVKRFASCIDAYNKGRSVASRLYPTIEDTLKEFKRIGSIVVAYTESRDFYTRRRIVEFGLDGLITYLYSPPDHSLPEGITSAALQQNGLTPSYKLQFTTHRHTAEGELKPNPAILLDIISSLGVELSQVIYVGDSLMKDISMAQDAGVTDVFAKYGEAQNREAYALLRRVSHWTEKDVEREKLLYQQRSIQPTYTLEHSFSELLEKFEFVPYQNAPNKIGQVSDDNPTQQSAVR